MCSVDMLPRHAPDSDVDVNLDVDLQPTEQSLPELPSKLAFSKAPKLFGQVQDDDAHNEISQP